MMNVRKHDAEMTIEGFLNAFLTEKNVKKALSFLDEDIYWTEAMIAHEASGLREVAAGLDRLVESIPDNDGVVVRFEKGRRWAAICLNCRVRPDCCFRQTRRI